MTYTPINWQTGDTITAEKMNKMDNGWAVSSTQLFNETVTTTDTGQGFAAGGIDYVFQSVPPDTAVITFDGISYTVERNADYAYGETDESGPNFTNYPFYIAPADEEGTDVFTETDGTHTIAFGTESIEVSSGFDTAVNACVDTSMIPMECISGTTTLAEIGSAYVDGRILFFKPYSEVIKMCFITDIRSSTVLFIPEDSNITATIENNVFTVTTFD